MNKAFEFNPLTAALSSKWQYARSQLTASAPVSAAAAIATATALSPPRVVATGSAACASLSLARRLTLPGKGIRTDVTERRLHGVGLRAARALVASVAAVIATFLTEASAVAAKLAGRAGSQAGACISAISAISAIADSSAPALACPAAVAALRRIAAVQRRLQVQRVVPLLIFLILRIARLSVFRHGLHTLTCTRTAATTS